MFLLSVGSHLGMPHRPYAGIYFADSTEGLQSCTSEEHFDFLEGCGLTHLRILYEQGSSVSASSSPRQSQFAALRPALRSFLSPSDRNLTAEDRGPQQPQRKSASATGRTATRPYSLRTGDPMSGHRSIAETRIGAPSGPSGPHSALGRMYAATELRQGGDWQWAASPTNSQLVAGKQGQCCASSALRGLPIGNCKINQPHTHRDLRGAYSLDLCRGRSCAEGGHTGQSIISELLAAHSVSPRALHACAPVSPDAEVPKTPSP